MRVEIKLPDLGTTTDEVTFKRWLVQVGQPVARGQMLFEIETDKAAMEVESVAAGTLVEVLVQPEDKVTTGQVIAILESPT
jgi:pyruvate/2-oxoglutarate dehydrogenase complex dihydrolipoamide acyltransferase (E2) component